MRPAIALSSKNGLPVMRAKNAFTARSARVQYGITGLSIG
jgi:hypothetical protein